MKAIYRSYQVLVEETAENHKTRIAKRTSKASRPNYENTGRALRVTHKLFQDAVCYYVRCIIGLIRDRWDARTNEPVNRLWEHINSPAMKVDMDEVIQRLAKYTPFAGIKTVEDFQAKLRAWCKERGGVP